MITANYMINIDTLTDAQADNILRTVMKAADFNADAALPATVDTREVLSDAIQQIHPSVNSSTKDIKEIPAGELIKQALHIFAADPDYCGFLSPEQLIHQSESRVITRDFAFDPISFVSATSLCLVVLSTYIDIKRDVNGRWTFEMKVNPVGEKVKVALIDLAKSLVSILPKS
jgi:hypothetical protein